ncbi:MAG: hypothetical protein H6573_31170 [Lewinellaceae bacterium]|nr:hypothetical protein [Lewinellaceae bacterium]
MLVSLSIPWGDAMGDDDESGYHLVYYGTWWSAPAGCWYLNAKEDVLRVLNYLITTQKPTGIGRKTCG